MSHHLKKILRSAFLCLVFNISYAKSNIYITGVNDHIKKNILEQIKSQDKQKNIFSDRSYIKKQIELAIYPYGYLNPQISITDYKNFKAKLIKISLGPRLKIKHFNISITGPGSNNIEIINTKNNIPTYIKGFFDNKKYEDAKDNLLTITENQGYINANYTKASIMIDKSSNSADIIWNLATGPRFYFGQIKFAPSYISQDLLDRYINFHPHEPYSAKKIIDLQRDLSASAYFKSVNIDTTDKSLLKVITTPVNRTNYSIGAGYGTDTGPRGKLGLQIIPVNKYGHKFNILAQGSLNENALQAQYIIPGQNPTTQRYSISGGVANLNYKSGFSTPILLSVAKQYAVHDRQFAISINGLSERYHYTNQSPYDKSLVFPKGSFNFNRTQDSLFSPSGHSLTINVDAAIKNVLSPISFGQISADAKLAKTIDAIRTRLYLHGILAANAISQVYDLPLSLALLLGGANNLKGYAYNAVGPGKYSNFGSIELQKETIDKLYAVGFIDVGDVYNPNKARFKKDVGAGIMWISPVGPIKLGFAAPMDNGFGKFKSNFPKFFLIMGPDL